MNKKVYFIFTRNANGTVTKQPIEKRTFKAAMEYAKIGNEIAPMNNYIIEMEYNTKGVTTKKVYDFEKDT